MGDGGFGGPGGLGTGDVADIGIGGNTAVAGNDPLGYGGNYGGSLGTSVGAGDPTGSGPGGVMDTKVVPIGGAEIKGGETPKVVEAKKAIPRSTRRRTLLSDEEGGLEPVPIYRRSILGS